MSMKKSCKYSNGFSNGSLQKGDLMVINRNIIGRLKDLTVALESCTNQFAQCCLNFSGNLYQQQIFSAMKNSDYAGQLINKMFERDASKGNENKNAYLTDDNDSGYNQSPRPKKHASSENEMLSFSDGEDTESSCNERLDSTDNDYSEDVVTTECSLCLEKMINFILANLELSMKGGGGGGGSNKKCRYPDHNDEGIHSDFNESDSCECLSRTSPTLSSDSSVSKFAVYPSYEYYIPVSLRTECEEEKCDDVDEELILYEFLFPRLLCGRLIGKRGVHVEHIREVAKTEILVRTDCNSESNQIVTLKGKRKDVLSALSMISERFPVDKHPNISLEPISTCVIKPKKNPFGLLKRNLSSPLPCNTASSVIVCCVMSPTRFFLQQPTKVEYTYLDSLVFAMTNLYENCEMTPQLIRPIHLGAICAVSFEGRWYRGIVCAVNEEKLMANVCYGDFGGYQWFPYSSLRMLRCDFGCLPFQATEVLLHGVQPSSDSDCCIDQVKCYFGSHCFQAEVVGTTSNGLQIVDMYYYNNNGERVHVKDDLITMKCAISS